MLSQDVVEGEEYLGTFCPGRRYNVGDNHVGFSRGLRHVDQTRIGFCTVYIFLKRSPTIGVVGDCLFVVGIE